MAQKKACLNCLIALLLLVPARQGAAQSSAERLVEVDSINVTGTRLPSDSVIKLSGIKLHERVNDLIVNAACHRITATGLIKTVDYSYDAYPDKAGVALNLALTDEGSLLPAKIEPPSEASMLWSCLEALDPIFAKELPPTVKALDFYATNLGKCLQTNGHSEEYVGSDVTADSSGKLTGILFLVRRYKSLSQHK